MEPCSVYGWLSLLCILTIFLGSISTTQYAQFYGGSMSFEIETFGNDNKAIIKILTAWKIGYGPCGSTCPYSKIGTSTSMSRSNALTSHNSTYLGEWSGERQKITSGAASRPTYMDFTAQVNSGIVEKVQLVNIKLGWEMEQAEFSVTVPSGTNYIDVKFHGTYWVQSNVIQTHSTAPTLHPWFMQTKIRTAVRSDTERSNRSPVLQIKPYYRLVLGKLHQIEIAYIDQDNDIVRCEASYIGTSGGIRPAKGLTVNAKDCVINFDVKDSNYHVNDTGMVLIDVMDFNKKDMILGAGPNAQRFPGHNFRSTSLSSVPLQFYFEVVDHLNAPEFIHPTPSHRQLFEIYVGARFKIEVFAKATDQDSFVTIERFFILRRDGIKVVTGPMLNRTDVDSRAKSVMVIWTPNATETGNHVLCSDVIDTNGEDAFSLHCFTITVIDIPNKAIKPLVGQPYFLQFPSDTDISCQVNSVCRFPIYAKTDNPGGITQIRIVQSEIPSLRPEGQTTAAPSVIDTDAKMIEISLQDPNHGKKKFCVKAFDRYTSFEQCTFVKIKQEDPCLSSPCQNSGECQLNDEGSFFQCACLTGTYGNFCEKRTDPCKSVQCRNGGTCMYGFCMCASGVTGIYCENVLSVCHPNSCHGHGICVDKPGKTPDHICQCTNSYIGQDCATNRTSVDCVVTPYDPYCTDCNPLSLACHHGKCMKNGNNRSCICPQGFTGQDCETELDTMTYHLNSKFVPPTLLPGSVIKCDPMSGGIDYYMSCEFPFYLFWNGSGLKPVVEVSNIPKDMILDQSTAAVMRHLFLSNIDGFNRTYIVAVLFNSKDRKPFKTGLHIVCLVVKQGHIETDYRCFNVEVEAQVVTLQGALTPTNGRLFESPSLPHSSEIMCLKGSWCHINVFTTYKNRHLLAKCENIVLPSSAPCTVFGATKVNVFPGQDVCHADLACDTSSFAAGSVCEVCLQASVGGESRCYLLYIQDKTDPCLSNVCQNNGLCNAFINGTFSCVCQNGFQGDRCHIGACPDKKYCKNEAYCFTDGIKKTCFCRLGTEGAYCDHETFESTDNQGNGARFYGSSMPTSIICYVGESCAIPTVLTGNPNTKPMIEQSLIPSGVDIKKIEVTQDMNNSHIYYSVTTVQSQKIGNYTVCIQSLNIQRKTLEKICYNVDVKSGRREAVPHKRPYFTQPTLPDDSTVECTASKACHMTLWIRNHFFNPLCPTIKSNMSAQDGIYVFQDDTRPSPCFTEVTIQTDTERRFLICFTLTTTEYMKGYGGEGESRCYNVEVKRNNLSGTTTSVYPLGCVDHEDNNFSCKVWNNSLSICKTSYGPAHTIAVQRCPAFCKLCQSSLTQPPQPTQSGACQDVTGVDCHTLHITNICGSSFGRKYCAKYCQHCSSVHLLTPGPDEIIGRK